MDRKSASCQIWTGNSAAVLTKLLISLLLSSSLDGMRCPVWALERVIDKKRTCLTAIELHIPFPKKASAYLFAICLNLPILMLLSCKWVRKGPFIRSLGFPTRVRLSHGSMVIHGLGWRTIPLVEDRGRGAQQISPPLLPIPLGWLAINLFSLKFYRANQRCLNKQE